MSLKSNNKIQGYLLINLCFCSIKNIEYFNKNTKEEKNG